MLRLKEINVEELKALGFREEDWSYEFSHIPKKYGVISVDAEVTVIIDKETGIIEFETSGDEELYSYVPAVSAKVTDAALDVLYDLIASGRVEKVTDERVPTSKGK